MWIWKILTFGDWQSKKRLWQTAVHRFKGWKLHMDCHNSTFVSFSTNDSGKRTVVSSINREALYLFISTLFSMSVSDRLWTAEGYQADRPPLRSPTTPATTLLTHCQASIPFNCRLGQQTTPALSTCQLPYNSHSSKHTYNHLQTHINTCIRLL